MEQRDKWVISIDYLRTRAVYEEYTQKNILVQFPLKSAVEENVEEVELNNMNDLLFDFANKLKGKTVIGNVANNSKLSFLGLPGKSNSFTTSNAKRVSILQQSEDRAPFVTAADLMPKLRCLYTAGIATFVHHVAQKACKTSVNKQQSRLGQLPDRAVIELARSTEQLLQSEASTIMPRNSLNNSETIVRFQQALEETKTS